MIRFAGIRCATMPFPSSAKTAALQQIVIPPPATDSCTIIYYFVSVCSFFLSTAGGGGGWGWGISQEAEEGLRVRVTSALMGVSALLSASLSDSGPTGRRREPDLGWKNWLLLTC